MASDFSVTWQCLLKRTIGFCYRSNSTPSKEQFFSGLQNLSSLHKIGWISAEKIIPFFKHASSSVAPKISMGATLQQSHKKLPQKLIRTLKKSFETVQSFGLFLKIQRFFNPRIDSIR
jgi:hypothetical protein